MGEKHDEEDVNSYELVLRKREDFTGFGKMKH